MTSPGPGPSPTPSRPTATPHIRWWLLALLLPLFGASFWLGEQRVEIDTDITSSIPGGDPVLLDARFILEHHPALDKVAIDFSLEDGRANPDRLVQAAQQVSVRLASSGFFDQVGLTQQGEALAELVHRTVHQLPWLFQEEELRTQVAPRLAPDRIREVLAARQQELLQLAGVGQADLIARDPLGLRELVLGRLQLLLAGRSARIVDGQLVSLDGRHLLLLATPRSSGFDTATARELQRLLTEVQAELRRPGALPPGPPVRLAAVGGFRAAIDNEETIRDDTNLALTFASLAIALLFLGCFPRPLLGLLALLPALAGVSCGLLGYSLFFDRISALALGFGGALLSITVDQGAAYLLFLDRTRATRGRAAAREIWWPGLFSTLTNALAFLALWFSGYPLLAQLGVFAALSLLCSFAFVHLVFPLVFPCMPPARRGAWLPLERWLGRIAIGRNWTGPITVGLILLLLLPFARPSFLVDLNAMNHVRPTTLRDEALVREVWGNVLDQSYLLLEAADPTTLAQQGDRLATFLEREQHGGLLGPTFAPAQLFPGPERAAANLSAWRAFWHPDRQTALRETLAAAGAELGFTPDAFSAFVAATALATAGPLPSPPAEPFQELLGINRLPDGRLLWMGAVTPGPRYQADLVARSAARAGYRYFDPKLFTRHLADHLDSAFLRMIGIIGVAVLLILTVLFFDARLVLLALAPLAAALVGTVATLTLLGRALDIPGLLLAIIVLGLGIDTSLFFLRSYQQLQGEAHESHGPMRLGIFLTCIAMLLGMGSMALADHPVLRSAGITGSLGTLWLTLTAFFVLPPFLRRLYPPAGEERPWQPHPSGRPEQTVLLRYRFLDPYLRFFARGKLRFDPMFPRLGELLGPPAITPTGRTDLDARGLPQVEAMASPPQRLLLDVGCGWGVPGAWLLARDPFLRILALEPDATRARVAARVFGERGRVAVGGGPDLPEDWPELVDGGLLLDVVHHLDEQDLLATLRGMRARLAPHGRLVVRATIPSDRRFPWERWLEQLRGRWGRHALHFRTASELTAALQTAGFRILLQEPTAAEREETWFVAQPDPVEAWAGGTDHPPRSAANGTLQ